MLDPHYRAVVQTLVHRTLVQTTAVVRALVDIRVKVVLVETQVLVAVEGVDIITPLITELVAVVVLAYLAKVPTVLLVFRVPVVWVPVAVAVLEVLLVVIRKLV
jgi:hypothetical protein